MPSGIFPAAHLNSASPNSVRITAICPSAKPISAISSAAIVIVLVRALYSSDSFPTLMSDPCFEVREELRLNRFVLISCDFPGEVRCRQYDSTYAGLKRQSGTVVAESPSYISMCRSATDSNPPGIVGLNFSNHNRLSHSSRSQRSDNRLCLIGRNSSQQAARRLSVAQNKLLLLGHIVVVTH